MGWGEQVWGEMGRWGVGGGHGFTETSCAVA